MRSEGVLAVLMLACVSCHSAAPKEAPPSPEEPRRGKSYSAEKTELLYRMDREMNALIARYTTQLDAIREDFERKLDSLAPPSQLSSVERAFRGYGAGERERYMATVDAFMADAVARTEALVGREKSVGKEAEVGEIESEALRIAAEIGGDGRGAGYGFVSGVEEIDERAAVTVELLRGVGDVPGLKDLGELRKAEIVELAQLFRQEVTEEDLLARAPQLAANVKPPTEGMLPRVGRFAVYQSGVLEEFRLKNQDSRAVVVAFQGDRLPSGRTWQFVQAVRHRVIRGGVVVRDFGWQLDPTTREPGGRVPLGGERIDETFLATETMYPGVNTNHSQFADTRDFTLVSDYATGLLDVESGEWLGSVRWQMRWIVSLPGEVRLIDSVPPSFDGESLVLRDLVARTDPVAAGHREASPHDKLATRVEATVEATTAIPRDLGGDSLELIATPLGHDRRAISAAGRAYLGTRRIALVTRHAGFTRIYDGNRGRYVVSLTSLPKDSPLRDLGFLVNDDVHAVNGEPVTDFSELWNALGARAGEKVLTIDIVRDGALRRLVYEIEALPANPGVEPVAAEDDVPENRAILDRLFAGEPTAIADS